MLVYGVRDDAFEPARRTRTAIAARHLCASVRAGPLGKAALWALGWAPWEF